MRSYRSLAVIALLIAAVGTSGCSGADLRDKFVRKKKEKPSARRYYAVKTYHVTPSLELYTKRYVLWKTWQSELEDKLLDDNPKKPKMAADQALSNLVDMSNMLVDEKADQLQKYVDDMTAVERTIRTQGITAGNQTQLQKRVEIIGFEVQRRFSYNDMRKYIRAEFRGSAADEAAKSAAVQEAQSNASTESESTAQPAEEPPPHAGNAAPGPGTDDGD